MTSPPFPSPRFFLLYLQAIYLVFITRQATWGLDALKTWQILIIWLWRQSISTQSDWGLCLLVGLEGGHDPPRLQLLNQVLMTDQLHTLNPLWSTSNSCIFGESSIASCVLFALNHPLLSIDFQYIVTICEKWKLCLFINPLHDWICKLARSMG